MIFGPLPIHAFITENKHKLAFSDSPTSAYVMYEWSLRGHSQTTMTRRGREVGSPKILNFVNVYKA